MNGGGDGRERGREEESKERRDGRLGGMERKMGVRWVSGRDRFVCGPKMEKGSERWRVLGGKTGRDGEFWEESPERNRREREKETGERVRDGF